ncbi:sirohydrochlorin chelatase [Effusibacillus consociatus]|uniref:Sirohydrochlorin chelatase n=1 Tax=Effusibacillus consociatus TaxID=1117041 RepID=A0ABV9PY29_9BACL
MEMKTGVVLVAHGSREPSANEELVRIAELLNQDPDYQIVQPAYLELAEPDIPTGIDLCVKKGADRVIVVPYFLLAGSHVREDLPRLVADASARHPGIPIRLVESLGYHPVLTDIVLDRVNAVLTSDEKQEEE